LEQRLPAPDGARAETGSLAVELFDAYLRMVRLYRDELGLSAHERTHVLGASI
jgi:hypothetical protein